MFLNMEVSALEADGRGKVISSPRVMTANQVEALIEQGVEIPYQQATSSGATSISFRKANFKALKVKPQIAPDGKISMILDVNWIRPIPDCRFPGLASRSTLNMLRLKSWSRTVGRWLSAGFIPRKSAITLQRIPFLGDLPYIGWLFKNREWIDDKTELLIFVTPRIVAEGLALR